MVNGLVLAAEAGAPEEGLKVITGMLVVGLIFAGFVVLGEVAHWMRVRRHRRRPDSVNLWRTAR